VKCADANESAAGSRSRAGRCFRGDNDQAVHRGEKSTSVRICGWPAVRPPRDHRRWDAMCAPRSERMNGRIIGTIGNRMAQAFAFGMRAASRIAWVLRSSPVTRDRTEVEEVIRASRMRSGPRLMKMHRCAGASVDRTWLLRRLHFARWPAHEPPTIKVASITALEHTHRRRMP